MEFAISIIGLIILLGFFGNVLFQKTGIPNTLWLLLFGMMLGFFNVVHKDFLSSAAGLIGAIAIIGILSDGGLHMDLRHVIREGFLGTLLMIVGLVFTVLGISILLSFFSFPLYFSILVAITLAGTSASVVIPTINSLSFVSEKLKTLLSIESISDTFSVVLALFIINFLKTQSVELGSVGILTQGVALEFLSAVSIGIIFGLLWGPFIGKLKKFDYSYAATLGALVLLFALSEVLGSSGAIAVFTAGVMLANAHILYKALFPEFKFDRLDEDISRTHELFAFLIRVFFFVFLGMVVGIPDASFFVIGFLIVLTIIGVRFIYVNAFIHFKLFSLTKKEKTLTYWMAPRGLSAAVLAIFVFSSGIPFGREMVEIVFSVIIISVVFSTIATFMLRDKNTLKETEKKDASVQSTL